MAYIYNNSFGFNPDTDYYALTDLNVQMFRAKTNIVIKKGEKGHPHVYRDDFQEDYITMSNWMNGNGVPPSWIN